MASHRPLPRGEAGQAGPCPALPAPAAREALTDDHEQDAMVATGQLLGVRAPLHRRAVDEKAKGRRRLFGAEPGGAKV